MENDQSQIQIKPTKQLWNVCLSAGALFWVLSFILWSQKGIDEFVLFSFESARVNNTAIIPIAQLFGDYGMSFITIVFVLYTVFSIWFKKLDAPLGLNLYIICSMGISGIAGDLLKEVFSRTRPFVTYADQITALIHSQSPAFPSGHTTKSIALILPFLFLVATHSSKIHKPIKYLITLVALGVCASRIVLGAHYLSDVLAGIGMALIGLPLTMLFANMILKQCRPEQLPNLSKLWAGLLAALTFVFIVI